MRGDPLGAYVPSLRPEGGLFLSGSSYDHADLSYFSAAVALCLLLAQSRHLAVCACLFPFLYARLCIDGFPELFLFQTALALVASGAWGILPGLFLLVLFVFACKGGDSLTRWQEGLVVPITETVCVLLAGYLVYTTFWLMRRIHYYLHGEYSNDEDFPIRFAKGVVFIPLLMLLITWGVYLADNRWLLGCFYLLVTVVAFGILLVILHPQRTGARLVEQEMELVTDRVIQENETMVSDEMKEAMAEPSRDSGSASSDVLDRLERELRVLVEEGELFLNPNLTMTELAVQLKTNRSYLSQVFRNRFHSSFYGYINRLRIRYAVRYAREHPEATRRDIASMSGFGSVRTMNRVREEYAPDEEF